MITSYYRHDYKQVQGMSNNYSVHPTEPHLLRHFCSLILIKTIKYSL